MASLSADQMQALCKKFGYTQKELEKHLAYAREAGLSDEQTVLAADPPPKDRSLQGAVKDAWDASGNDFKTFVGNMADAFGWDRESQERQAGAMMKDMERVKEGQMSYAELRGLYG